MNVGSVLCMTDQIRVHVRVHGRVQGVFFRATVSEEAQKRGVTGWVKNREDGAVEAEFQGDKEKVDALIEVCKEGSDHARVVDMELSEIDTVSDATGFEVR